MGLILNPSILKKVQLYDITLLYMLGIMEPRMFIICIKS